jgi:protein-tyrosine phosphatase
VTAVIQRVLFVCLGNICRSPLAEGVFRHLVAERGLEDRIEIDSAGTGGWHVGEGPDPRSLEVAARNGVSLDGQAARRIEATDLGDFQWIVAMDADNERDLRRLAQEDPDVRIHRLRDFDPEGVGDVPDPYYGGPQGFDTVYAMVERSCRALLDRVEAELDR